MRRAPAYLAESIRVLAAEYSSTLRKVQSKTPHAALPPPATKGPEKGTPSRRMQAPPTPHFVLILSSNHCERHARHQTTTSGRQTASGDKRFGRQGQAVWATRQRAKGSSGPHAAHLPPHFPLRPPPCQPRQIRNSVRRRKTSKNRDFIGIFLVFPRLSKQEITVKMLFITVLQGRTDLFHYLCPVFN